MTTKIISRLAMVGLFAKGTVYLLLGVLTACAGFSLFGKSENSADKSGVFSLVGEQSGGKVLLAVIAIGLVCYCIWRLIQSFSDSENKGSGKKGLAIRARYFLSAAAYGAVAFQVCRMVISDDPGSGDSFEKVAAELLSKPFGQWLIGVGGLVLAAIGFYQIYYGYSEKYRKHVDQFKGKEMLLKAGKIGYVARGVVWLLLAWLLIKSALHANPNEAGDTSQAFSFLNGMSYGSYLIAAIGMGLICYGIFNFIRARCE